MWKYAHPKLLSLERSGKGPPATSRAPPRTSTAPIAAGKGNEIAVLSYTSGTTGIPKACILTHHYLLEAPARIIGALDFKPYTQYLSYISPRLGDRTVLRPRHRARRALHRQFPRGAGDGPGEHPRDRRRGADAEPAAMGEPLHPRRGQDDGRRPHPPRLLRGGMGIGRRVKLSVSTAGAEAWAGALPRASPTWPCCATCATASGLQSATSRCRAARAWRPRCSASSMPWACRCATSTAPPRSAC